MAVLEKIRVKFGLAASIIIAIGLLSFIIDPGQLETAFNSMSSKYDVGEIDGKSISYADFQQDVEKYSTISEMVTGSSAQSAQQQAQARDAAWQDLIYKHLFVKNANSAGLYVGEDELLELTAGNSVSPMIAQSFVDENGMFSKEQLRQFVASIDSDPSGRMALYWNNIQNSIVNSQYYSKYVSLFSQSGYVNPLMLRKSIEENNNTTNVEFVMVPFGYQTDTTINVSSAEIKSYYNAHKKFYKQQASRDIEYVVFEVKPSAEDITRANDELASLHEEFAATDNMKSFLTRNSARAYDNYYYRQGELNTISSQIEDFVWNGNEEVSCIIQNGTKFYAARIMESALVPDSVYVRHILLGADDAAKVDSLLNVVKSTNFSEVAALYSVDNSSAADGELGNIGWMTQTYMIPGFESVITADVKKPFVLKTQYGTHIVEVTKKTAPVAKKKVAILEKEAIAGKKTMDVKYAEANRFATAAAAGYDAFKKASDTLSVHPVNNMLESSDRLGSIDNTKAVTRWVFENKEGKVSPIITVDNNYFFVAAIKNVHKEGYASVNEVASSIREQLYYEKLAAKKEAETAEKISGMNDLQAIADALGTTVSTKEDVAFSSLTAAGLDPKFIGALSVAPEGKICGPVAGSIGVYVFKVTGRDTGSFYTEDDARTRQAQMAMYNTQMLIPVMMNDADVKDNRARFY